MTIKEAIIKVFNDEGKPLSANVVYDKIIENDYYRFKSTNPQHIVLTAIRRSCVGLQFPSSKKVKHFQILSDGRYWLKDAPIGGKIIIQPPNKEALSLNELKKAHGDYVREFKRSLLKELKAIDPFEFETFSKNLLRTYGFKNLEVTRKRKDGGIDGFGELKLGVSYLNVAFECKRWDNKTVGIGEVDRFRGAIQGDFVQGIFITTSSFTKEAIATSTRKGALPIALIDGKTIVEIMIDKQFGVDVEELPTYINVLPDVMEKL